VDYPVAGRFKFFPSSPDGRPCRPTILVRITASDGSTGWGQSVPSPRWSYETPESVRSTIDRHLGPALTGLDPFDMASIQRVLDREIAPSFSTGQPICKAGLDLALFDLTGRARGETAGQRWSRAGAETVPLSWTLNPATLDDAAADIATAHARGYRHFNVKIAPAPKFDLDLCRLIRELAPAATLWADANGGYDTDTALAVAPKLAELGVAFLEQPVRANCLSGFAALKRQGALPVIMDEGVVSVDDLREFHQLNLLDGVAVKVARCGGLTTAKAMVDYLQANSLIFLGSGLTDPDLSLAASLLLFGAHGLDQAAALNGPQFLRDSVLCEPLEVRDGCLTIPRGPGLGVAVDERRLQEMAAEE
jgi:L-alanine-DL-glutamate epimerase-like enolase superfamily enzyme